MRRPDRKSHRPKDEQARAAASCPAFIDATRRGLLQGAAVAVGATLGAGVASAAEPPVHEPVTTQPGSDGYRLTEHVREYYAKARF